MACVVGELSVGPTKGVAVMDPKQTYKHNIQSVLHVNLIKIYYGVI